MGKLIMDNKELHFKDILLLPNYSEVLSREDVNTTVKLGEYEFKLPVVPANMKTILDEKLAIWLAKNGYFYIMHRFGINGFLFHKLMRDENLISSISIGVNEESYHLMDQFSRSGSFPQIITLDIAHGHSIKMKNMLDYLNKINCTSFIIAGNVCTPEAVSDLEYWGAECVKLGTGSGYVCSTKLATGFSRPQFSAVLECAKVAKSPLISDGGVEFVGDISKALVAGATMVMAGRLFAGLKESPGGRMNMHGDVIKEYYGSASEHNKGNREYIEGKHIELCVENSIVDRLKEINHGLRSAISYAGGHDLSAFLGVKWIRQS